jgi:hypothetical protein
MDNNVTKLETSVKGLFMCISFDFRLKHDIDKNHAVPSVSFLVLSEDEQQAVEWGVTYGAITILDKCGKDYIPEEYESIQSHWYLGWCKGYGRWTQCAVTERGLPEAVVDGNFEHIFEVLSSYLD